MEFGLRVVFRSHGCGPGDHFHLEVTIFIEGGLR
jgi:hypothetical protein